MFLLLSAVACLKVWFCIVLRLTVDFVQVSIRSKTYALKVVRIAISSIVRTLADAMSDQFKFYDDMTDRSFLSSAEKKVISVDLLRAHMDPFYSECRAYGRLIDGGVNGKVAVRCYGYLTLPAELEEQLRRDFNVELWNRSDYDKPASEREPFRAIVKDLIMEEVPWTEKVVKKMLRDLHRVRKLGVYVMDVQARNYRGGLLIDFSIAMTEPHYLFVIKPSHQVATNKRDDLLSFQEMIEEKGIVTWERAVRNWDYCEKLRPRAPRV